MKNVVLLFILMLPLSTIISSSEAKPAKSFSVDLIHRDSPLSPMYNSSMTLSEHLQNAAFRSISRFNSFHHTPNNDAYNGSKVQTTIKPNQADYLMKIFIGSPPLESLVVADTGSDLTWVQCTPCSQCYPQDAPMFDPLRSSTYQMQNCLTDSCDLLLVPDCGDSNECVYKLKYVDKSASKGELASDTIGFDGTNSTSYPNFLFGCGHYNTGGFKRESSGLAGLGRGQLSLMSQLGKQIGHKFSYCLNSPYFGLTSTTSKLKFGSESTITSEGLVTVPLDSDPDPVLNTVYPLGVQSISVGDTLVYPFQHYNLIFVDSGTTFTMLESNMYKSVLSAVLTHVARPSVLDPPKPFNLCFEEGFGDFPYPNITLHFVGANEGLQLQHYHLFARFKGLICFLIIPENDRVDHSVLGNMAQVNFEVQFDLEASKVSFAPADCTKE